MKLKCTKVMAKLLNEKIKDYEITLEKMTERQFAFLVDLDSFNHEIDFDCATNKFNVLCVNYPQDYYANNRYITTKELIKIYNQSNKTLDGFIQSFFEYVEI